LERRAEEHATIKANTKLDSFQPAAETSFALFDDWFGPVEAGLRERGRGLIEETIPDELDEVPARPRYGGGGRWPPVTKIPSSATATEAATGI